MRSPASSSDTQPVGERLDSLSYHLTRLVGDDASMDAHSDLFAGMLVDPQRFSPPCSFFLCVPGFCFFLDLEIATSFPAASMVFQTAPGPHVSTRYEDWFSSSLLSPGQVLTHV
jgi:hypothetical protein